MMNCPRYPKWLRSRLGIASLILAGALIAATFGVGAHRYGGAAQPSPKSRSVAQRDDATTRTAARKTRANAKPADSSSKQQASSSARKAPRSDERILRGVEEEAQRLQFILGRLDQARRQKTQLESRLDKAKKAPSPSRVVEQYLKERELESLQAQLHLVTDEVRRLRNERNDIFESFEEDMPRMIAAVDRRIAQLKQTVRKQGKKPEGERARAQLAEMERLKAAIEAVSGREGAWRNRLGKQDSEDRAGPAQGKPIAPRLIQMRIRRIEREQEALMKIYRQNEESLQRLHDLLKPINGDDISAPPPPPPSPDHARPPREGKDRVPNAETSSPVPSQSNETKTEGSQNRD